MSTKTVRILEMTPVAHLAPGVVGDGSNSSGSPQPRRASSRVASRALESLTHSPSRPSTATSGDSAKMRRVAWQQQPQRSIRIGGLSVSTRSICDQPSWIDENAGKLEEGGLGWKVVAAVGRFFYGLAEIALVRPIGFCLAACAATACLVAGVVMAIIGVITCCWCPQNLQRAKACFQLSKLYAEAALRVIGNPLGLAGRAALVGASLLAAIFTLPGACYYGLEPTKKCLRYAGYNFVSATRHLGEITRGVLTGVPSYFARMFCGECCYKSLKSWYWSNVAEALPKPDLEKSTAKEIVDSHKQSGFYQLVRNMTGGDSLARGIVHRND